MKQKSYYPVSCSCVICRKEIRSSDMKQHSHYHHQILFPKPPSFIGNCKNCGQLIRGYPKKQFCNSSCSATNNNKLRPPGHPSRSKGNESRSYKLSHPKKSTESKIRAKYTKVSLCISCNKWFAGVRKTCSKECFHAALSNRARNKSTHPCNRSSITYNGIKLGSSFELTVAKSLDANNIKWCKPSPIKYKDPTGKIRQYFPDFYLPEFDVYLDPKNDYLINNPNPYHGYKDVDKIKWAEEYNNVRVIVLNSTQLSWIFIKSLL